MADGKSTGKINHDITLEEIERECREHQKENEKRNIADECRTIAKLQREQSKEEINRLGGRTGPVLRRLLRYMLRYKWLMALAIALSVSGNLLALLGPMLSGKAIDAMTGGAGSVDFSIVIRCCVWMLILYVSSGILSYLLQIVMQQLTRKIVANMRSEIFSHLLSLPVSFYDTHASGDIISRITYDVDTINTSLSNDVISLATSAMTIVGSLGMMILISPRLCLIFAVTVPMTIAVIILLARFTRPLFRARSGKLGELNGLIEEMFSGQKSLKAYHQEVNTIRRFQKKNEEAVDAYYRADYMGSMVGPTVNLINNISLTLVTVFGALLYLQHGITLGNISSFVLYSRKFSGPINESANIISELQSVLAAGERVFRLMDELPEEPDRENALEMRKACGEVEFRNVCFSYTPEKPLIRNLNLHAEPGRTIAIVGPTGAGKTTIINLLMRFYDIDSGEILLDGHDTRDITRDSLRKQFAMVLQDTWLFYGTIYENLAYGNPDATREDVCEACKAARIHRYIMKLPNQYDTILTDEGTNISKGQKQLLTIARAMLLNAPMLILDEATSNVDTRTEMQIQEAMSELMKGKTCFVIAHRLSTIRNADTILVIRDGAVVEQGRHEELMARGGEYRKLYDAQFAGQTI